MDFEFWKRKWFGWWKIIIVYIYNFQTQNVLYFTKPCCSLLIVMYLACWASFQINQHFCVLLNRCLIEICAIFLNWQSICRCDSRAGAKVCKGKLPLPPLPPIRASSTTLLDFCRLTATQWGLRFSFLFSWFEWYLLVILNTKIIKSTISLLSPKNILHHMIWMSKLSKYKRRHGGRNSWKKSIFLMRGVPLSRIFLLYQLKTCCTLLCCISLRSGLGRYHQKDLITSTRMVGLAKRYTLLPSMPTYNVLYPSANVVQQKVLQKHKIHNNVSLVMGHLWSLILIQRWWLSYI